VVTDVSDVNGSGGGEGLLDPGASPVAMWNVGVSTSLTLTLLLERWSGMNQALKWVGVLVEPTLVNDVVGPLWAPPRPLEACSGFLVVEGVSRSETLVEGDILSGHS
jgi:hypothetical protein